MWDRFNYRRQLVTAAGPVHQAELSDLAVDIAFVLGYDDPDEPERTQQRIDRTGRYWQLPDGWFAPWQEAYTLCQADGDAEDFLNWLRSGAAVPAVMIEFPAGPPAERDDDVVAVQPQQPAAA